MLSKANEPTTELKRYLDSVKDGEATKIPKDKQEKPSVKKDEKPEWFDKKSDEHNEYEYSDNKEVDDTKW